MIRMKTILFAMQALLASGAFGQHPAGSLLTIETEHHTVYVRDVADYALLATKPGPTPAAMANNFLEYVIIGDIVSVNGRRAKGTVLQIVTVLRMGSAPGQVISDTARGGLLEWNFEILDEDGRPIGSIRVSGTNNGPPPPGATQQILGGNFVVLGGTGAYLGVRGYMGNPGGPAGAVSGTSSLRIASMSEDPANRRLLGGGSIRQGIYILPMFRPEIMTDAGGPAIVHSADHSLVTAANPARAGEILTLFASGLGPTRPGVEPDEPFPADPPQPVNSPVEVILNGKSEDILYARGYPGAVDRYQVEFRVPDDIAPGLASVRLSSAWIGGSEVKIAIQ
jgi:hypothetical protein